MWPNRDSTDRRWVAAMVAWWGEALTGLVGHHSKRVHNYV
jgi:hypothetical protein